LIPIFNKTGINGMTPQNKSVSNVTNEAPERAPKRRIDPNRNPAIVRFINDTEVGWRYGISRPSVWRWVKTGLLPEPEALGPNTKRWRVATLDNWDEQRAITQ
jgi:prophage regulatory protein